MDSNNFDPECFSPERNEGDVPFSLVGFGDMLSRSWK
jgi:hypothetical protein